MTTELRIVTVGGIPVGTVTENGFYTPATQWPPVMGEQERRTGIHPMARMKTNGVDNEHHGFWP